MKDGFQQQLLDAAIMMVDDEPITMKVVQAFLEEAGYGKFVPVEKAIQAMKTIEETHPDILLLDLIMPEVSGFDILSAVRLHPRLRHLPIIVLTSSTDTEHRLRALDLGATDFLAKPVNPGELVLRVRNTLAARAYLVELEKKNSQLSETIELLQRSREKIKRQNKELEVLATQDALTGCLNKGILYAKGEEYLAEATAEESNLACMMADIDLFKSINDRYGHAIGDEVIKYIARTLQSAVRGEDAVCRYGGDEFCILLPKCDIKKTAVVFERVRSKIGARSAQAISQAPGIRVSVSFGVSDLSLGARSIEELIQQADRALYKAKEGGRNRLVSWHSDKENEVLQRELRTARETSSLET